MPRANMDDLRATFIPIPPIDVQNRMTATLDTISEVLRLRKAQLAKLDNLVKSQFVEMFGEPVTNSKEWYTVKLDNACNAIGDGLHGTPIYDEHGDYYFINGSNLCGGEIVFTESTQKVGRSEYERHGINLDYNTILISINGSLGKTAFYNGEPVVLGKSACYLRIKDGFDKGFVYGVLNSREFQAYIRSEATASTINNVSLKTMREFQLIAPPLPLQHRFADFVRQLDKSKAAVQKALDETQRLFNSLMAEYFED